MGLTELIKRHTVLICTVRGDKHRNITSSPVGRSMLDSLPSMASRNA